MKVVDAMKRPGRYLVRSLSVNGLEFAPLLWSMAEANLTVYWIEPVTNSLRPKTRLAHRGLVPEGAGCRTAD